MIKSIQFKLDAPDAEKVTVAGSFNNWDPEKTPLKKDKKGVWTKSIRLPKGWNEYKFVVDGQWQDDPSCSNFVCNNLGGRNCVIVVE